MKRRDGLDKKILSKVRNRLLVGHKMPRKLGSVLKCARGDLGEWLPSLLELAAREKGPASATAIKVLKDLVNQAEGTEIILEIYWHLPRKSSVLAEVAAQVTKILLDNLPTGSRSNAGTEAMLWNNFSERCHDDNRPKAAWQCAETAVKLIRCLLPNNPAHKRIKVICLLTLAKRRAERGMTKKAYTIAKEAWERAAGLGSSGATDDRKLEAQAAINCANRLAALGKLESAIKAAKRGVKLLSKLPDSPEVRYDLAIGELVIANQLTRCGRHEESLPHADSAERLFRVMTGDEPDEYFEFAAAAANTYALNLSHTGRLELAYDLSRQSVERMEVLVRRQPTRFGLEHVTYLISLADSAGDFGKLDDAVAFAKQAVSEAIILGRLLRQRQWFLEGVAGANLFNLLYRLQKFDEAEKAIRTAHRAFKHLPASHPEARSELARSLRNLAEVLRIKARPGQGYRAVKVARKAVHTMEAKPTLRTDAFRQLASQCYTTLALCLEDAGQRKAAIAQERLSLKLRRKLFAKSKQIYRGDLAYSLYLQASRLLKAGVSDQALRLATESIHHYEVALPTAPERTAAFMADAMRTLAEIQYAKCQHRQGIGTLVQAIHLLKPRYEKLPDVWRASLLPLSTRYVELCRELGMEFDESLVQAVIADAVNRVGKRLS